MPSSREGIYGWLTPELQEFVGGTNIAVLATVRKDGSPSLSTVWYEVDRSGLINVSITKERAKYRHILRDPRVALCITTERLPYKQVVVEGPGSLLDEGAAELVKRLFPRYYGPEEGRKYAEYSLQRDHRVLLQITPERVHCWNFDREDDHHHPWSYDVSGLRD